MRINLLPRINEQGYPATSSAIWRWVDEDAGFWVFAALAAFLAVCGSVLWFGVPQPSVHDEFAYLLQAETFAHGRLTNPAPAHPEFFESFHILVSPSYTAKYPPGQAFFLALGQLLGHPIFGVWLSIIAMCAAIAWAARALVSPRWALIAGVFCALQFGLWHYWVRSYWGGAVAAFGGALVLGATLRLLRNLCWRHALLCGAGAVILMLTRPFEGLLVCIPLAIVLVVRSCHLGLGRRETWLHLLIPAALAIAAGVGFVLHYNQRVTGSPWTLPYMVYEKHYSGAPVFVWQQTAEPPKFTDEAQRRYYEIFVLPGSRFYQPIWRVYYDRLTNLLWEDIGIWGVVGLGVIATGMRSANAGISLVMGLFCSLSLILCYWYSLHYQSPALVAWVMLATAGWESLFNQIHIVRWRGWLVLSILAVVGMVPLFQDQDARYRGLRALAAQRAGLEARLKVDGRNHLVFVHKGASINVHEEWVYNGADLASEPVIWAHDLGDEHNRVLEHDFPNRQVWRLFLPEGKLTLVKQP